MQLWKRENLAMRSDNWLFVFQTAPVENGLTADGLDLCLVAASFGFDLKLLFIGDGLLHIVKSGKAEERDILLPNYTKTFKALADFGIEHCFVFDQSLKHLNLGDSDISIELESINAKGMRNLLSSATQVFSF